MKEQGKKIMETENTKDVEIDLEKVGDKVVGGNGLSDKCAELLEQFKKYEQNDTHQINVKFEDKFTVKTKENPQFTVRVDGYPVNLVNTFVRTIEDDNLTRALR